MNTIDELRQAMKDLDALKSMILAMEADPLHAEYLVRYKTLVNKYNQVATVVRAIGKNISVDGKSVKQTVGQISVRISKCSVHKYDAIGLLTEFPEALEIEGLVSVTEKSVMEAIEGGKLSPSAIKHKKRREDLDYNTVNGVKELTI